MARQLENNFRERLCKDLKAIHAAKLAHIKFHGGAYQSGLPDTLISFEGSTFIEFKADTDRYFERDNITDLQRFTLRNLWLSGTLSGVWHWNHLHKKVQCFPYPVLLAGTWKEHAQIFTREELLNPDATALRKALFRDYK